MVKFTTSEENYLKAVYRLQGVDGTVSTTDLARELSTRPASVTDMIKKLKTKKLLHYERYQGVRLTPNGSKAALGILRRHRLWEYFLAEKLRFSWDEVHAVAEDLEHVRNEKLIDKLDEFLGFPRVDPHGDPIPDASGRIHRTRHIPLTELPLNTAAIVSQVRDQSSPVLELLEHRKLHIGSKLEIRKKFAFDQSLELKTNRQPSFTISRELAENIYVTYGT